MTTSGVSTRARAATSRLVRSSGHLLGSANRAETQPVPIRGAPDRVDFAIALLLTVAALVTRRHVLPHDGLAHDDAWAAVGATHGSLRHLLTLGYGDPGFTIVLRTFWAAVGGRTERLAFPVFVVGTLVSAGLYLAVRRMRYARSNGVLIAAPLVGATLVVTYSGHIKTYIVDAAIVLGLIVIIPRIVSPLRTRRWLVVGLVVGLALCTFSVFALVATVTAVVFAALQTRRHRAVRAAIAAVLVVAASLYLYVVQNTHNVAALHAYWRDVWDGYVELSANPIRFVEDIFRHVARTGYVYPGGTGIFAGAVAGIAIASIGISALRARRADDRLRARYAGMLVLVTLGASITGSFVFGPKPPGGSRVALWMLPVLALGVAIALEQLRQVLARHGRTNTVFDVTAYAVAAVVILVGLQSAPTYRFSGSSSATRYIESHLQENDSVLLLGGSYYNYAASTRRQFSLLATPKRIVGFTPVFRDTRIRYLPYVPADRVAVTQPQMNIIRAAVRPNTRTVFVYVAGLAALPPLLDRYLRIFLVLNGFKETRHRFESCRVSMWTLNGAGPTA